MEEVVESEISRNSLSEKGLGANFFVIYIFFSPQSVKISLKDTLICYCGKGSNRNQFMVKFRTRPVHMTVVQYGLRML